MKAESVSLREQQAHLTRDLILDAVIDRLREDDPGDLSVPEVAERSGVSLRTVYRHYPTRDALLAAASERIAEMLGTSIPESIDQMEASYTDAFGKFDGDPGLARAMALSPAGRDVRAKRRRRRLELMRRMLVEVTDQLPEDEARRAEGVFCYLNNMLAWVTMRDEAGLEGTESAKALSWAMNTLFEDLRRRNEAARNNKGGTR